MYEKEDKQHLDKIWKINLIIWGAIFASLPVYLIICKLLAKQQLVGVDPDLPINMLTGVLVGVSILTFFVTSLIRRKILNVTSSTTFVSTGGGSAVPWTHQVSARYTVAIAISAALSESIGIYGFVIFLLSQNFAMLYQFLFLSAVSMYYFRPRKEELMDLAANVKRQQ